MNQEILVCAKKSGICLTFDHLRTLVDRTRLLSALSELVHIASKAIICIFNLFKTIAYLEYRNVYKLQTLLLKT